MTPFVLMQITEDADLYYNADQDNFFEGRRNATVFDRPESQGWAIGYMHGVRRMRPSMVLIIRAAQ